MGERESSRDQEGEKNCIMESEKIWNNEKRNWDREKPGEQFLYQGPEKRDPACPFWAGPEASAQC